jgi:hypothetical protein
VYSVTLKKHGYKHNCRTFWAAEDKQVVTAHLSGELEDGKQRIVLEWSLPSADLDLFLSFNPQPAFNCMVGFVAEHCGGATFGADSSDRNVQYEAIEIDTLTESKYLVFVQSTNGIS